uniref:YCII-related domain-containing protein n=1 Tax=Mycena chlorophos TaxID=658473 RepID=A0ABQ0LZ52_MYCCL|nr:predicted protein [Mycena chlorophos]
MLQKFLVYAPDHPDAAERREAFMPEHWKVIKALIDSGVICVAGPLLSPESIHDSEKRMVGSLIIFQAENIEAVRMSIEKDLFYLNDVWDKERIVILPFEPATAFP